MSRSRLLAIITGFFALTLAVYAQSLGNMFVAWDDTYLIINNPIIRGLSWQHIVSAFTSFDPELYDPLIFLVYQLNYTIAGLSPFIFHATNLLFHVLNALGVCWLLVLLTKKQWMGIVGGFIFAVHPLHTEAVAWASALKDVLSTFFFLLSVIAYLHYRDHDSHKSRNYYLSIVFLLLGLLSKVMVLTLPVVLILLDLLAKRPLGKKMMMEKIPYFLLSVLFGCVALFGKSMVVTESTLTDKILMAAKSTVFYIGKFFWPVNLSVLYPYAKPIVLTSPDFLFPLIGLAILIGIAVGSWKRSRAISIGILFYLLTLAPTFINFAKGGYVYIASDRYAYIPSIGLLLLVLMVIGKIVEGAKKKRQVEKVVWSTSALVIAGLAILAHAQSLTWKNTETLFLHTIRLYPQAQAARLNLGFVYKESNMPEKALEQFEAILLRDPKNAQAYTNIGAVYEKQGRITEAIEVYKKGMEADPRLRDSFFNLGMLYEKENRLDEALELYRKVQDMSPDFGPVYNNMGSVYVQKNDLAGAAAAYEKAISINPYYGDAHFNLAYVYAKQGKTTDAIAEYETTLAIEGEKPDILRTLAGLYAEQNKMEETVRTLRRILAVDPANAFAQKFLQTIEARSR